MSEIVFYRDENNKLRVFMKGGGPLHNPKAVSKPAIPYKRLSTMQKVNKAATMGNGVELKDSTYKEFGKGVFATRDFEKGEWVTVY